MDEFNFKEFGSRIRNARKKSDFTIEKLCEIVDISPSFLGSVERGESRISIEKLYKLSETLNVSTDYLLKGEKKYLSDLLEKYHLEEMTKMTNKKELSDENVEFLIYVLKFLLSMQEKIKK